MALVGKHKGAGDRINSIIRFGQLPSGMEDEFREVSL